MPDFLDQFNNDPVSTTNHTTSYTIPAGGFAKVKVTDLTTDFKIASVIMRDKDSYTDQIVTTATGIVFTNNTPYILVGSMCQTSTATIDVWSPNNIATSNLYTGTLQLLTASGCTSLIMYPNDRINVTSVGAGVLDLNLKAQSVQGDMEFWVTGGTLIEGSEFTVELYNKQGA